MFFVFGRPSWIFRIIHCRETLWQFDSVAFESCDLHLQSMCAVLKDNVSFWILVTCTLHWFEQVTDGSTWHLQCYCLLFWLHFLFKGRTQGLLPLCLFWNHEGQVRWFCRSKLSAEVSWPERAVRAPWMKRLSRPLGAGQSGKNWEAACRNEAFRIAFIISSISSTVQCRRSNNAVGCGAMWPGLFILTVIQSLKSLRWLSNTVRRWRGDLLYRTSSRNLRGTEMPYLLMVSMVMHVMPYYCIVCKHVLHTDVRCMSVSLSVIFWKIFGHGWWQEREGLDMFTLTISSCLNFHVGTLSLCLYLLFRSPTCASEGIINLL